MKTSFFVFLLTIAAWQTQAQKLHLIFVSDYENKDFGMISLKDEDIVGTMFKKVGTQIGYQLKTTYINKNTPEGFTIEGVWAAVKDTSIQAKDIVIFYYSGFGVYTAKNALPSLQLNNKSLLSFDRYTELPLDHIASFLQTKGIRLGMVMADCRNTLTTRYPTPLSRNTEVRADRSKEILKKLFLGESCRILKIASAQKGQPVFSMQRNSVFTYSLTEAFEDMLATKNLQEVSLDKFLARINTNTKSFISEYTGLNKVPISCTSNAPNTNVRIAR